MDNEELQWVLGEAQDESYDLRNRLKEAEQAIQRVREFLEYRKANSAVARDGLRALDGDGRG